MLFDTLKFGLEFWDSTHLILMLFGIVFIHEISVYFTESGTNSADGMVWIRSPLIVLLEKIRQSIKSEEYKEANNRYQLAISKQMPLNEFRLLIQNAPFLTRFIIPRCCGWIQLFIVCIVFAYPEYIIKHSPQIALFWMLLCVSLIQIIGAILSDYIHNERCKHLHKILRNCKIVLDIDTNGSFEPYELTQIPFQIWCNIPFPQYATDRKYGSSSVLVNIQYCFKPIACILLSLNLIIGYYMGWNYSQYFQIGIVFIVTLMNILQWTLDRKHSLVSIHLIIFIVYEWGNAVVKAIICFFTLAVIVRMIHALRFLIKCVGNRYVLLLNLCWIIVSIVMQEKEYAAYRIFSVYVLYISHQFELIKDNEWTRKSISLYLLFGWL